jgi:hypothetical protein
VSEREGFFFTSFVSMGSKHLYEAIRVRCPEELTWSPDARAQEKYIPFINPPRAEVRLCMMPLSLIGSARYYCRKHPKSFLKTPLSRTTRSSPQ